MSEKFPSTLRIGDLNDFIAPSQGCIVSLKGLKTIKQEKVKKAEKVAPPVNSDPVKISLKDCLACSGCITSAETVMLEKQSLEEFLLNIEPGKAVIISLSPQSRASLAAHFGLSPSQDSSHEEKLIWLRVSSPSLSLRSSHCLVLKDYSHEEKLIWLRVSVGLHRHTVY